MHKGNIMKFTEGAFRTGATRSPSASSATGSTPGTSGSAPRRADGEKAANDEQKAALAAGKVLIKDAIADITLQQVLTRPTSSTSSPRST